VKLVHPDGQASRGLESKGWMQLPQCARTSGLYELKADNGIVSKSRNLNLARSGPLITAANVGECEVAGVQGWTGQEATDLPTFSTDPFFARYAAESGSRGWQEFVQR